MSKDKKVPLAYTTAQKELMLKGLCLLIEDNDQGGDPYLTDRQYERVLSLQQRLVNELVA